MQPRVVACVPVPKAIPGSMTITRRRRNFGGSSHGGVTQNDLPTRRGLMNRFQDCSQFSCLTTFHGSRGSLARGLSRAILKIERLTSRRSEPSLREDGKKASSPLRFRTTPGEPRSITTLDSASMFAALVRIDSCNQDCATIVYATAPKPIQLTRGVALSVVTVLSKSPLPDIEMNFDWKERRMKFAAIKRGLFLSKIFDDRG